MVRRNPFTLIEIMAVIAIAVMLMALVVPAFSGMAAGRTPSTLGSQLRGALMMTQGTAVTNRKYAALLFDLAPASSRRQSCRVCFVQPDGSDYKFLSWVAGEDWIRLPAGAVIAKITATGGTSVSLPNAGAEPANELAKVKSVPDSTAEVPALIFSPLGQLEAPANDLYFHIVEGQLQDGGIQYRTGHNDYAVMPNKTGLELHRFTGRTDYL